MAGRRLEGLKDPFSSVSHGIGLILAIAGVIALTIVSRGSAFALTASLIYGAGLIFVYGASSAYHATHSLSPWPQRLDHISIYVMIAGTYTPVCLLALPHEIGIPMLVAQWSIAGFGLILNLFLGGGHNVLRVALYLIMGWMAVATLGQLRLGMSPEGLFLLLAGGITYTLGTVIYATERPKLWPGKFDAHDLWHLFVLAASGCHYTMVMGLVHRAAQSS